MTEIFQVAVPRKRPFAVYRGFSKEGVLLYVGMTQQFHTRMRQHEISSPWWQHLQDMEIDWFGDRTSAARAERLAIRNEAPAYNSLGQQRFVRDRRRIISDALGGLPDDRR